MKAKSKSEECPTPGELAALAVSMYGAKFSDADGNTRRRYLAEAAWAWRLAREVVATGQQSDREKDEAVERELAGLAAEPQASHEPRRYSLDEAAQELGYKRGKRSLLELAVKLDKAQPDRFGGLRSDGGHTGLAAWITGVGEVDELQLAAMRKFKTELVKAGRRSGGRQRVAKTAVK